MEAGRARLPEQRAAVRQLARQSSPGPEESIFPTLTRCKKSMDMCAGKLLLMTASSYNTSQLLSIKSVNWQLPSFGCGVTATVLL